MQASFEYREAMACVASSLPPQIPGICPRAFSVGRLVTARVEGGAKLRSTECITEVRKNSLATIQTRAFVTVRRQELASVCRSLECDACMDFLRPGSVGNDRPKDRIASLKSLVLAPLPVFRSDEESRGQFPLLDHMICLFLLSSETDTQTETGRNNDGRQMRVLCCVRALCCVLWCQTYLWEILVLRLGFSVLCV